MTRAALFLLSVSLALHDGQQVVSLRQDGKAKFHASTVLSPSSTSSDAAPSSQSQADAPLMTTARNLPPLPPRDDSSSLAEGAKVAEAIGRVEGVKTIDPRTFLLSCTGSAKVLLKFYRPDIVRIRLAWEGEFDDPADEIIVGKPLEDFSVELDKRSDDFFEFRAAYEGAVMALRASRGSELRFELLRAGEVLWSEAKGLTRNGTATLQTLTSHEGELFFGGGMQNGGLMHRGRIINVDVSYNWVEGGSPNAAPVYMSSRGYGAFRCTWAGGTYDFRGPPEAEDTVLAHREQRFDAFFFGAPPRDYKTLLEAYTYLTGRPFMPPIYALGMGDSDCYHNARHSSDTRVATSVANSYDERRVPVGWMLVNDGYGCGYGTGEKKFPSDLSLLQEVTNHLSSKSIITGLWSGTNFDGIKSEVEKGVRVLKTDVAWVGKGGKFAFDAVTHCMKGIEDNSDARRFIWTVEGWAGTQRMAVMWTGDHFGSFDAIRWQIPTFAGCGFSGQAHVSGDIDGIFGGSAESQVRDLQWKCLTTVMMSMSGWSTANPDKQPYSWGEPYSSINNLYLNLKLRLTPYFYALSRLAHDTGTPPIRAMAMEFPEDKTFDTVSVASTQQFMAGPFFLVAPVYKSLRESKVRSGIYLPEGGWIDFWSGYMHKGPKVINDYDAPLDKLPLFVRMGAIIPMWQRTAKLNRMNLEHPLSLEVYPSGESSFELYDDDGVTRTFAEGMFLRTTVQCFAAEFAAASLKAEPVKLLVEPDGGIFDGLPTKRTFLVNFHVRFVPGEVLLEYDDVTGVEGGYDRGDRGHSSKKQRTTNSTPLEMLGSVAAFDFASTGWFFDRTYAPNVTHLLGYTQDSWPRAFSTNGKDCAPGGADCPNWRHSIVSVKVTMPIHTPFQIIIRPKDHQLAAKAKFLSPLELNEAGEEGWAPTY